MRALVFFVFAFFCKDLPLFLLWSGLRRLLAFRAPESLFADVLTTVVMTPTVITAAERFKLWTWSRCFSKVGMSVTVVFRSVSASRMNTFASPAVLNLTHLSTRMSLLTCANTISAGSTNAIQRLLGRVTYSGSSRRCWNLGFPIVASVLRQSLTKKARFKIRYSAIEVVLGEHALLLYVIVIYNFESFREK